MTTLASIRPDSWNLPLLVHVLGAMLLVGATLTSASVLAYARGDARFLRLGYWTLLAVGLPGYLVMRIGAEWIADKWGLNEEGAEEPTWIGIGNAVADAGLLILVIALVVGGVGVYRLRSGRGAGLFMGTLGLSLLLLFAYVIAIWAMSGKPD